MIEKGKRRKRRGWREVKAPKLGPFSVWVCVAVRRGRTRPGQPADLFHMFPGEREAASHHPTHSTTSLHLKRQNSWEANHPQHYVVVLYCSSVSFSVDCRYQFQVKMDLTEAACRCWVSGSPIGSWLLFDRGLPERLRGQRKHTQHHVFTLVSSHSSFSCLCMYVCVCVFPFLNCFCQPGENEDLFVSSINPQILIGPWIYWNSTFLSITDTPVFYTRWTTHKCMSNEYPFSTGSSYSWK